jgi:hypothetical protein
MIQCSGTLSSCIKEESKTWIENVEFSENFNRSAKEALGSSQGVIKRLNQLYPSLSDSCLTCFGEVVACGVKKCFVSCLVSPPTESCLSCTSKFCTPAFKNCLGVSTDEEMPLVLTESTGKRKLLLEETDGQEDQIEDEDYFVVFGSPSN